MTFNLETARALHDRGEHDPRYCGTCLDSQGNGADWPCPTATALGATGRTEWEGPTDDPDTLPRVHIPAAGWYHIGPGLALRPDTTTEATFDTQPTGTHIALEHTGSDSLTAAMEASLAGTGTLYVPKVIEFDARHGGRCFPTCDTIRTEGDTGYIGPNTAPDSPCILLDQHQGPHTDRDGDRWGDNHDTPHEPEAWPNHADPCPAQSITDNPDKHCIQHRGHTGPHYFALPDDYTPCYAPGPLQVTPPFCSLGAGHQTDHRNLNGFHWAATPEAPDTTHPNHWNRCTHRRTNAPKRRCILDTNHINNHEYHDPNALPDRCTATRERPGGSRITCALDTDHTTPHHVNPEGIHWGFTNPQGPTRTWPNAGDPCTLASTPARACVFTHDHHNAHYYVDTTTYTPCGQAWPHNHHCAMDTNHHGPHRTPTGDTL